MRIVWPALIFVLTAACSARAQTAPAELRFDVASVKPIVPGSQAPGFPNVKQGREPARYTLWHATLGVLIRIAYKLEPYRLSGPVWIDDLRFDLVATMPATTTDDQVLRMLQTLLADRFQLKLRREVRESAVFALVVGKNGPRLTPAANPDKQYPTPVGPWGFSLKNTSMHNLASMLMRWLDRPVIDMTGLTGIYDVDLSWKPLSPDAPANPLAALDALDTLGLKAESRKAPIEFVIVEQARKTPIEN